MTIVRNPCVVHDQMGGWLQEGPAYRCDSCVDSAAARRVRLLSACYFLCVHYNQVVLKLLVTKRNGAFRVLKVILQSAR